MRLLLFTFITAPKIMCRKETEQVARDGKSFYTKMWAKSYAQIQEWETLAQEKEVQFNFVAILHSQLNPNLGYITPLWLQFF